MRWTVQRQTVAAGTFGLAMAFAACVPIPGNPPPPGGDLDIQVTKASSSCGQSGCTGSITFLVTNNTDEPTTEEPFPTVDPDNGTAQRVVSASTCDDAPLAANGDSCTETFNLSADDGPLTGTISVDAGNLEGSRSYSA